MRGTYSQQIRLTSTPCICGILPPQTDATTFACASLHPYSMVRSYLCGMDMSAYDYDGRTALHLAAAEGHLASVRYWTVGRSDF